MNNLLSYCGLVDAKIRASDIDLPVLKDFKPSSMNLRPNMLRIPGKGIHCQGKNTVANTVDTLEDNLKVTTDHQS